MQNSNIAFLTARSSVVILVMFLGFAMVNGQDPTSSATAENYRIGPGDVIDVTVSKNADLSRTGVRVGNGGEIQLAMMDTSLQAACSTEKELAESIKEKYRKFLVEPYVIVSVREFNSSSVAVIGAVNSPGRFQFQRSIQLVELLTFVNGTSVAAGETAEIIRDSRRPHCDGNRLVRPDVGGDELITVDLNQAFNGGDGVNPAILPGDIVRIPTANVKNAYIQGNIRSSIAINLKEPTTLTQAIAMAGGPAPGAQLDKVKIRRQVPGTVNREELIADVKAINKRQRDDILLEPNDIIEIPGPTGVKKVFGDILKTIVPTITQLPVRVIP